MVGWFCGTDTIVILRRVSPGVPFGRQCTVEARVYGCRHSEYHVRAEFLLPLRDVFGDPECPKTGGALLLPRSIKTGKGTDL
jgi:hypothetical protein